MVRARCAGARRARHRPERARRLGWTARITSFALFAIGAGTSLLTRRGVFFSGLRQLLIGLAAAGVTFGVGRLIGVAISG
jgi:VIT1/CCC1 family predicted Fe2+/Mn2+ transporter